MSYAFLAGAIICEVNQTLLLLVINNFTRILPVIGVLSAYSASFYLLTFLIRDIPTAIVYACWAAFGVMLVTLAKFFLFGQALQWQALVGLVLIAIGVILVNVYSKVT